MPVPLQEIVTAAAAAVAVVVTCEIPAGARCRLEQPGGLGAATDAGETQPSAASFFFGRATRRQSDRPEIERTESLRRSIDAHH